MPDVLFDTGKYTLKSGARERLARVAGIVLAYPDLHVQVEGHTDNVGSAEYNQQLSEQRANTVREYLTSQGVKPENIDSHGFGLTQPIASNDTAAGRQLNRRVDLVVTGQVLGNVVTKSQSTQTETVTTTPTVDEGQGVVTPTPGSSVGQPSAVPSQTPPQGSQSLPPQWI